MFNVFSLIDIEQFLLVKLQVNLYLIKYMRVKYNLFNKVNALLFVLFISFTSCTTKNIQNHSETIDTIDNDTSVNKYSADAELFEKSRELNIALDSLDKIRD